jgi:hypothetical protein
MLFNEGIENAGENVTCKHENNNNKQGANYAKVVQKIRKK